LAHRSIVRPDLEVVLRAGPSGASVMKDKPMGRTKGGRTSTQKEWRGPSHDEIALKAYELFEQRGGEPGHEQDDWLQAERDLRHPKDQAV